MILEELLKDPQGEISKPPTGSHGIETDWLPFCELELRDGQLLIIDPAYLPPRPEKGILVDLQPGKYVLEAKVMECCDDKRASRIRAFLKGSDHSIGDSLGEASCDTSQVGFCDFQTWSRALPGDVETAWAKLDLMLWKNLGVAELDREKGAIMPYISSEFGDGEFPVYELVSGSGRVGVEVEFIASEAEYPF